MTSPTLDDLTVAEIDRELAVLTNALDTRVNNTDVAVAFERRREDLLSARRLAVVRERARARQRQADEAREARAPSRRWRRTSRRCCARRRRRSMPGSLPGRGSSALSRWAIEEGYIESTPFKRGGQVIIRLTRESPRARRLAEAGEEERLLQRAGPHLRDLILAGIATGCHLGELLSLQWKDVRVTTGPQGQTRQYFVLVGREDQNGGYRRVVPVGTRLAAVLDLRRHAPDGTRLEPDAYVFGNLIGEPVKSIKKDAHSLLRFKSGTIESCPGLRARPA